MIISRLRLDVSSMTEVKKAFMEDIIQLNAHLKVISILQCNEADDRILGLNLN
jgi:hypothetical protein